MSLRDELIAALGLVQRPLDLRDSAGDPLVKVSPLIRVIF